MSASLDVTTRRIYDAVLARGRRGRADFYAGLRAAGFAPTPDDEPGNLYAPNPVVVPRRVVDTILADLEKFCDARRAGVKNEDDLLELVPESWRERFISRDVAARIVDDLGRRHPQSCLDAYLVERDGELVPSYLEWQTQPTYPATAASVLGVIQTVFPEVEANGGTFSGVTGEDLAATVGRLRRLYVEGVEDDPRQAVLVDFEPSEQATRGEFYRTQEVTGGRPRGIGVIDPREVFYRDGHAYYRRDNDDVPIRVVFSRLVAEDLEDKLWPTLGADERDTVGRFFRDGAIAWRVHPVHFRYGSKADFPAFHDAGLSDYLPECRSVTADVIAEMRPVGRLEGWVQKPTEGHGGRDIIVEPTPDDLDVGSILQRVIRPANCHLTLDGPRAPEVRVMALPGDDGHLVAFAVFSRVKAPDEFRSNAGVTAAANVPGTGEGYAVIAG